MASNGPSLKTCWFVGAARDEVKALPVEVQDVVGYALHLAQCGEKHGSVKPLKGFGGSGVLEIVEDHKGDAYRAVYTIKFAEAVYVLHAFQKKSSKGIATPKRTLETIKRRLRMAEQDYRARVGSKKTK